MTNGNYLQRLAEGRILGKAQRQALVPPRKSTGAPADEAETARRRAEAANKRVNEARRIDARLSELAAAYAAQGTPPAHAFTLVDGPDLLHATKRLVAGFRTMDPPAKAQARADHWLALMSTAGAKVTQADTVAARQAAIATVPTPQPSNGGAQ